MAATPGSPKSSSAIPTLLQVLFQAHPRGGSSAGCSRASQSSKRSKAMRMPPGRDCNASACQSSPPHARCSTPRRRRSGSCVSAVAGDDAFNTVRPSCYRSPLHNSLATATPIWEVNRRFIYWMCELSHTSPAPAGARHDDACGQGDVSDDERVCRVRARHDSGTRPRRACEGPERGEASWPASDSSCAGETNP